MFKDLQAWAAIRRAVLVDGVGKRQICRQTGITRKTLKRILQYESPPAYKKRGSASPSVEKFRNVIDRIVDEDRLRPSEQRHTAEQIAIILSEEYGHKVNPEEVNRYLAPTVDPRSPVWDEVVDMLGRLLGTDTKDVLLSLLSVDPLRLSLRSLKQIRRVLRANRDAGAVNGEAVANASSNSTWILRLLLGKERLTEVQAAVGDLADLPILYRAVRAGELKRRTKALVVLASRRGMSLRRIARILRMSGKTVCRYLRAYRKGGATLLLRPTEKASLKRNNKAIRDALFEVLHSPPSTHGINRTTWKMADLRMVLAARGIDLSEHTIRAIIKDAGYRWRKARKVLTSNDPYYREKLMRMTAILSALKPGERFFSIDEFGPFAVKLQGGRVLAGPGEVPSVPQFQKSKGSLIVTAALELSTNQVTHFYSKEKNTREMLKLIDRLLDQYSDCEKLYLSWDAGSWHDSHALHARVEAVNNGTYRAGKKIPKLELVPLPSRAQFLNVIESVFSGMARAIIHNSDYQSVAEAMEAIDRYFRERNEHFRLRPKRAGKKIWGKEPAPSEFSESNNYKDPRWCRES
jgi:transposase